jgi:hypothetical protein
MGDIWPKCLKARKGGEGRRGGNKDRANDKGIREKRRKEIKIRKC